MEQKQPGRREEQFSGLSDLAQPSEEGIEGREQSGALTPDHEILEDFSKKLNSGDSCTETALCGCVSSCDCAKCECISKDVGYASEDIFEDVSENVGSGDSEASALQKLYDNLLAEAQGADKGRSFNPDDIQELVNEIFTLFNEQ